MTKSTQSQPAITEKSISDSPVSRRNFLSVIWKTFLGISGILSLSALTRFFSYQISPAPPTEFDLGPVNILSGDSIIPIPEAQAALIPGEDGFQAISLVCTHLGCLLELQDDAFTCPCHGSIFNLDGAVQKGPADKSLRKLEIKIDEKGHLILDTSENKS
jgi:cytochrome b6-f complex iron-sulfur subunit